MSKSRKKFPAGLWGGSKSQKKGKQWASKRFRRLERRLITQHLFEELPTRSIEITSPWDLGGDGKCVYGFHGNDEYFRRLMRK